MLRRGFNDRSSRGAARPAPRQRSHGSRGQSLVEFALILPITLLLMLTAIDFGRVYLGWVNLENMARIASNFAANHPTAWLTNDAANVTLRTQYANQVKADAAATNCSLTPTAPAAPTFTDSDGDGVSTGIGDQATVTFTCSFKVITPVISNIVGGSVLVSSTAVFPVKSALSATSSGGGGCIAPTPAINANPTSGTAPLTVNFADASGGGTGTAWLWDFGDGVGTSTARDPGAYTYTTPGTYVVTLTVSNLCASASTSPGTTITVSAASPNLCTVPNFTSGGGVHINNAQDVWSAADFTTTVQQQSGHSNGNYRITSQSIVAGSSVDCASTITVNG